MYFCRHDWNEYMNTYSTYVVLFSTCIYIFLSIYLSIYVSIYLSIYIYIHIYKIYVFICIYAINFFRLSSETFLRMNSHFATFSHFAIFPFSSFSNSELQETHFYSFHPFTSLLLWETVFNNIILISFLGYFIALYLCFYILG